MLKIPRIINIHRFSSEFVEKYNLSTLCGLDNEAFSGVAGRELQFQTWLEYFSSMSKEKARLLSNVRGFNAAVKETDRRYPKGADFGQAFRVLKSPFRISDLEYYIINKKTAIVKEILDYTQCEIDRDCLLNYAQFMGRNVAGLMNEKLANHLWSHRQDYSLAVEICDEAYNEVDESICGISAKDERSYQIIKYTGKSIEDGAKTGDLELQHLIDRCKYYTQFFILASSMKVIEEAYSLVGRNIPEDYKALFVGEVWRNLNNRAECLQRMK